MTKKCDSLITDEFGQAIRVLPCVALFPQRNVAFVDKNIPNHIKVTFLVSKQTNNIPNHIKVTHLIPKQAK